MAYLKILEARNLNRTTYSLPYFPPEVRDLINLIPPLLCLGNPEIGIYNHIKCTDKEYELLKKYIPDTSGEEVGKLPYRISVDSIIAIPEPSITNENFLSLNLVIIPSTKGVEEKIKFKFREVHNILEAKGIYTTVIIPQGHLSQLLIYEIMRLGIVLAGKYPVTNLNEVTDSSVYIGELPRSLDDATLPEYSHWNPFQFFMNNIVSDHIKNRDHPTPLAKTGENPYIFHYMHILHTYEEELNIDQLERIRICLYYLFSEFPPTLEVLKELAKAWNLKGSDYPKIKNLTISDALRLRQWLIPLEKDELPLFTWPPLKGFALDAVKLSKHDGLWHITQANYFSHQYLWVVLVWGALAGLINSKTTIKISISEVLKHDVSKRLMAMLDSVMQGIEAIVPQDALQGSITVKNKRFFFQSQPFALLQSGNKHCIELWNEIKKKTLIDDVDLEKYK